jgi:Ca2+:H+ antiporter
MSRRASLQEPRNGGADAHHAPIRRTSSDDEGKSVGAMSFLHTVKAVQRANRMEKLKLARAKSHRGSFRVSGGSSSERRASGEHAAAPFISERMPLKNGSKQEAVDSLRYSSDVDVSEELNNIDEDKSDEGEELVFLDEEEDDYTVKGAIQEMVFGKGIVSLCLIAAPFAVLSVHLEWGAIWIFWLNFIVMVPLAAILGDFTEELALHTNQTIGGLINATFGNAVEVVVAIQALLADEIRVVQASMLGSIFSNLLLVLGSCFFFGGLYHKEQSFNSTAATANMGLLALSSIALVLPTPFAEYYQIQDEHVLVVSRFSALFMMFMYVQLLYFQLSTHAHLFEDNSETEIAKMPFSIAAGGLLTVTLLITFFSSFLVNSIEAFTIESGVSRTFVGLILLPIVGNAVEHVTAVTVAVKNKMDLAMGVAVGSCTQISLFVVPLTVLVGWAMGKNMTLNFPHFEIILFVLSIMTVSIVSANPTSNWLVGSLLITTYCLICVGFWFENVVNF